MSNRIGSPSDLRRVHRSMVLRHMFSDAKESRTQLAEQTGLSAMAITRIIRELIGAGLVKEGGKRDRNGNPGRRRTDLRINPSGAYVVGLVISAFGHEIVVTDAIGNPVAKRKLILDDIRDPGKTIEAASEAITSLIGESGVQRDRVVGIGIAIAAFVDSETGTVVQSPYFGWREVDLGPKMARRTGFPVVVENNADATNLAEQFLGKARGGGDVFLVHTSAACGASYTHQGTLVRGANFSAGQIGHLPAGRSPLVCSCGATDCLNTHASGWSVLAKLGRIEARQFRVEDVETYARALSELVAEDPAQDSPEGRALFEAGRHLGYALRNISLVVDPETVVLAGKLPQSSANEAGCRAAWTESPMERPRRVPELIVGSVTPFQAAAFLALDSFLYSPRLDIDGLFASGSRFETEAAP